MKVKEVERNYEEMWLGFRDQYVSVYHLETNTEHFVDDFTIIYFEDSKAVILVSKWDCDGYQCFYEKHLEESFSKEDVEKLLTDGYHLSREIMSECCESNDDAFIATYLLEEELCCMYEENACLRDIIDRKNDRILEGTTENNILQHELAKKEKENGDLKMLVKLMKEYGDLNESKRN